MTVDSRIGSELHGYRLEALIGRGGMGVVYRAHDPRLKRDVALKLLAPELAEDRAFRDRFLRESELAAALEHPNVVPIHDVGETDGQLFIVMRLVEGRDLRALLREGGKLEPWRALELCSQVAAALDAAHEGGLVHRDVKPSNVLVDRRDHAYLADFGLTRRLSDPSVLLEHGLSFGTPAYVAPEQIRGGEVDGRADQYSLGCVLYECLAGEHLFPRSTEAAVLFAHLEEAAPATPGLESVLPRALAKSPADRYESCASLVDAARNALGIPHARDSPLPHGNTKRLDVTVPGATNGGTTLATTQHFNSVRDIQNQVADARVWIGFDYRNSAEQGLRLGNDVAGWALDRYFKPAQQLVPNEGRISPTAASCSSAMTRVARWCGA